MNGQWKINATWEPPYKPGHMSYGMSPQEKLHKDIQDILMQWWPRHCAFALSDEIMNEVFYEPHIKACAASKDREELENGLLTILERMDTNKILFGK